jgi:hypothetical protein
VRHHCYERPAAITLDFSTDLETAGPPVPVWSIRKDYLLSEAFELTGRRLFGDSWNTFELGQRRVPSPDELSRARAPFVEALDRIEADIASIGTRLNKTTNRSEIRKLTQQRETNIKQQAETNDQLISHPEATDTRRAQYEAYQRRITAETTLVDAIKRGIVKVHDGRNRPIDNLLWGGHPHFGYDIELSAVRVPRSFDSRRFLPARIAEKDFDKWLLTVTPLTQSGEKMLSPMERCRIFLRRQIEASNRVQQKPKEAYFLEAQAEIAGLSRRTYDTVWTDEVPDSWKAQARRRWPN